MSRRLRGFDGISLAIGAACLFGASTPFAKLLVSGVAPALLAGLLYLGSGIGLGAWVLLSGRGSEARIVGTDWPWLAGAVVFGGIAGPLLLMLGLTSTPGSSASLLLNLEGVFTAALAWFVFKENFDGRVALGMALIVAGGCVLTWGGGAGLSVGSLAIAGACACWAIDNNLTQKVSQCDPAQVAAIKGAVAGIANVSIALGLGARVPSPSALGAALLVGFAGYGLSLMFFVRALRGIGTARTGAYFSLAPFVGVLASFALLHERVGPSFWASSALMAAGVWLHVTEHHEHAHVHDAVEHAHAHTHDEHHEHTHAEDEDAPNHSHPHRHDRVGHSHRHFPDLHHRHDHD